MANRKNISAHQFSMKQFMREALRSGFIAAIAMILFALLFSAMGLRINEYGKKVIQFLFPDFSPGSGRINIKNNGCSFNHYWNKNVFY